MANDYWPSPLVESIALAVLRIRRARRLEAEHITAALHPRITRASNSGLAAMLNQLDSLSPEEVIDPGVPASLSAGTITELADGFARYETMLENRLYRALNQLRQMQAERQRPA